MLPTDRNERKALPMATGVLDYFPDALAAVADVSRIGNDQHNPGQPLHWSKHLSTDHADCLVRHLVDRGRIDTDGARHTAKVAWRALALLQMEIEADRAGLPLKRYIEGIKNQAAVRELCQQATKLSSPLEVERQNAITDAGILQLLDDTFGERGTCPKDDVSPFA